MISKDLIIQYNSIKFVCGFQNLPIRDTYVLQTFINFTTSKLISLENDNQRVVGFNL